MNNELIAKYNIPVPRYTSFPAVPFWKKEEMSEMQWKQSVINTIHKEDGNSLSIYIHLPFCESLCTFCGCHKYITKQHSVEVNYIQALLKEWAIYTSFFAKKPVLKGLHLGGGTPTFFSPENLDMLLSNLLKQVDIAPNCSFSFEGDPNNTTKEHLQTLYSLGFRRVSFGVQDYSPIVQKVINRVQSFAQVQKVHNWAKEIGYSHVSHDLIFGLPKQTICAIAKSIDLTMRLKPERISLYSYAHVPWVKGVGQRAFSEKDLPQNAAKRTLYEFAKQKLLAYGYVEVGMDHFALPTDELFRAYQNNTVHRNFMGYTTAKTPLLIGLGMSAISETEGAYSQNQKNLQDYLDAVNAGKLPLQRGHFLSAEELELKEQVLNIMCRFETSWSATSNIAAYYKQVNKKLKLLAKDGIIKLDDDRLKIHPEAKMFVRNVAACFDPYYNNIEGLEGKPVRFSATV